MATVTDRVGELDQGLVWLEVTYDDVTLVMSQVAYHNGSGAPRGHVTVSGPKGVVIVDTVIPAGDSVIPVTGRRLVSDYSFYVTDR